MGNELVEFLLSHQGLQVVQEVEPLLVGDARERIVGVLAFQVSHQLGELVVGAIMVHRVCERLPADDGREMAIGLAVSGQSAVELKPMVLLLTLLPISSIR